jgi:hypothetical protein
MVAATHQLQSRELPKPIETQKFTTFCQFFFMSLLPNFHGRAAGSRQKPDGSRDQCRLPLADSIGRMPMAT